MQQRGSPKWSDDEAGPEEDWPIPDDSALSWRCGQLWLWHLSDHQRHGGHCVWPFSWGSALWLSSASGNHMYNIQEWLLNWLIGQGGMDLQGIEMPVQDMGDVLGSVMEGGYEATARFYPLSDPSIDIGCMEFTFTLQMCWWNTFCLDSLVETDSFSCPEFEMKMLSDTSKRCVLWNMILQSFIGSKLHDDIWIKAVMIARYTACSTSTIIVNLLTFHRLKVLKVITIRIWPDLMILKLTPE